VGEGQRHTVIYHIPMNLPIIRTKVIRIYHIMMSGILISTETQVIKDV
jgi:hypothetical protein